MTRGAVSLRLFQRPAFRALWIGQLISIFGDRFTYLALLALVVEQASDRLNPARELALIPVVSFLPAILFSPWVGALVDAWSTRMTLILSDFARGLTVLAIIPAVDHGGLPAAFALVFLLYVANCFFLPARSAILPELVPPETLVEANSLATLAGILATILGSLLAGWLVDRAGWRVGFLIDSATYFASVVALVFIRADRPRPAAPEIRPARERYRRLLQDVREGGRAALRSRPIRGAILALSLLWVAGGALHVSVPTLLERRGSGAVIGMGSVIAFAAAGMVAGALFPAIVGVAGARRKTMAISLIGSGIAVQAFALWRWPGSTAVAAFVAGMFVSMLLVSTETLIQREAPPETRARIFALRDFLARLGVLGSAAVFGFVLDRKWLAPPGAVLAAGTLLVVVGALGAVWRGERGTARTGD